MSTMLCAQACASAEEPLAPPAQAAGAQTPEENEATAEPTPEPEKPSTIASLKVRGKFATIDITYNRAGRFLVLDAKGSGAVADTSDVSISAKSIRIVETSEYTLVAPGLGSCPAPPKLSIEGGAVSFSMQGAAEAGAGSGPVSACHIIAQTIHGVAGQKSGMKALFTNVTLQHGRTVEELVVELDAPN